MSGDKSSQVKLDKTSSNENRDRLSSHSQRLSKLAAINQIHKKLHNGNSKLTRVHQLKDDNAENNPSNEQALVQQVNNKSANGSGHQRKQANTQRRRTLNEKTNLIAASLKQSANFSNHNHHHSHHQHYQVELFNENSTGSSTISSSPTSLASFIFNDTLATNQPQTASSNLNNSISKSPKPILTAATAKSSPLDVKLAANKNNQKILTNTSTSNKKKSSDEVTLNAANTVSKQSENLTLVNNTVNSLNSEDDALKLKTESNAKANSSADVLVPKWRIIEYKVSYKLEGTEDSTDDIFLKRHQKYENEEKQIKRWDMRRQREEMERNKLLKGRLSSSIATSESKNKIKQEKKSIQPKLDNQIYLRPYEKNLLLDHDRLEIEIVEEENLKDVIDTTVTNEANPSNAPNDELKLKQEPTTVKRAYRKKTSQLSLNQISASSLSPSLTTKKTRRSAGTKSQIKQPATTKKSTTTSPSNVSHSLSKLTTSHNNLSVYDDIDSDFNNSDMSLRDLFQQRPRQTESNNNNNNNNNNNKRFNLNLSTSSSKRMRLN